MNGYWSTSVLLPHALWLLCAPAAAAVAPQLNVTVDATRSTHTLRPQHLGCHLDSGYGQELRALSAQMLISPSFELGPPVDRSVSGPNARPYGVGWLPSNGDVVFGAMGSGIAGGARLSLAPGSSVSNRGLGMEGLFLQADAHYEGYVVVRKSEQSGLLRIALEDFRRNATLAVANIRLPSSVDALREADDWAQLNYSFVASGSTGCEPARPYEDGVGPTCYLAGHSYEPGQTCVRCPGQLTITNLGAQPIDLGYVRLQPGLAQRYAGLPILKSGVELLRRMATRLLRVGGTFAVALPQPAGSIAAYDWRNFIHANRPWLRPPFTWGGGVSHDHPHGVYNQVDIGPFELLDLASASGIDVVYTTAANCFNTTAANRSCASLSPIF